MADSTVLTTVRIVSTPGVLGGKPRIEGTRISVEHVARHYIDLGWPLEEIAEAYKLTLSQIHAALAYYFDHRAEIDRQIKEHGENVDRIEREQRDFAKSEDVLNAVMTPAAIAHEFKIDPRTVRDAIEGGKIAALKSAGTWLIRREDAEARWGKRK